MLVAVAAFAPPVRAQANSAPEITSPGPFTVVEGTTAVTTLTATDAETAQTDLVWSIPSDAGGADSAQFTLGEAGALAFAVAKDYEEPDDIGADGTYDVTVQVSDGTDATRAELVVTLQNVTELTTISGPSTVMFAENGWTRVATFTASSEEDRDGIQWTLGGDDAVYFSIDSPAGALRFDIAAVDPKKFPEPPDFEAPVDTGLDNAYTLTLSASDGSISTAMTFEVTVTVTDLDEDGELSLSTTRPALGKALTASLSDPDTVVTGTTVWKWERSTGRNTWAVIAGATAASHTPTAADTNAFLRVTATYEDGHGPGKSVDEVAAYVVAGPLLTALAAETTASMADTSRALYPAFSPETLHYGIGCGADDTMMLTLSATADARVTVNGVQVASGAGTISVSVTEYSDVSVDLADASGALTTYSIHCAWEGFFNLETIRYAGATGVLEDLLLFPFKDHIIAVDNNGVPRLRRSEAGLANFGFAIRFHRVGDDGAYRYAHSVSEGGSRSFVIRDEKMEVFDDNVTTVSPLTHTNTHDFQILGNGNYMLTSNNPAVRDLSRLPFVDPNADNSAVSLADSAIQIVTPSETAVFTWISWNNMALEDCVQHRFPLTLPNDPDMREPETGYAWINGVHKVGDRILASFRGCSKVLSIDADTGTVVWRVGRSNLSTQEWKTRMPNIGPPPLRMVNDPEGEFCGQHTARFLPNGNFFLYDNGVVCTIDPWTFEELGRESGVFSRAVEYAVDLANGEVVFVRDHSLLGARGWVGFSTGSVDHLENGDWLVSWGRPAGVSFPNNEAVTQVDPATGEEKFAIRFKVVDSNARRLPNINASVLPAEAFAPLPPGPLTAEFSTSAPTSTAHSGTGDAPQVLIVFSQPVVDTSVAASLQVQGATVASVGAYIAVDAPANAYLVTLTPDNNDPITVGLATDQPCASGVCTATGQRLSKAPAAHHIRGPVAVSFGAAVYTVAEGASVDVAVRLDAAHGDATDAIVPLSVAEGTASPDEYAVPQSILFGPAETGNTVTVQIFDDALAEGNETVTLAIGELPPGFVQGEPATTTVTVQDDDPPSATVALSLDRSFVNEGDSAVAITVTATLDGSAGTADTEVVVTVGVAGDSAVEGTDYAAVSDFTLTIPARQTEGMGTFQLRPTDDDTAEGDETIALAGDAQGLAVTGTTLTLIDNDTDSTSVALSLNPPSVSEGAAATVVVTAALNDSARPGATAVRITVGRSGDSAKADTDYQRVADFTVTIPANASSGVGEFEFIPVDDATVEGNETLTVSGVVIGLVVLDTTLTLVDNGTFVGTIRLDSVALADGALVLTYDRPLDEDSVPAPGDFAVRAEIVKSGMSVVVLVTFVEVRGQTLTLTLERALEPDEEAVLHYTPGTNPIRDNQGNAAAAIDAEAAQRVLVSVAPAQAAEGEPVLFPVTLSLAARVGVTVDWTLADGTATEGSDYPSDQSGSLDIPAGDTEGMIEVLTTEDSAVESHETFTLTLTRAAGFPAWVALGTAEAVGTILNDDNSGGAGGGGGGSSNHPPVVERQIEDQTVDVGGTLELDIRLNFYDRDQRALEYTVVSADPTIATVEVERSGIITIYARRRGVTAVMLTAADRRGESVSQTFLVHVTGPALVPLFPEAADMVREGFLRLINHTNEAGEISITAIDDNGASAEPITLAIAGNAVVQFNSTDLEDGNAAKGLFEGVGPGEGDWRLVLDSELDFEALSYIRTEDGFLTSIHDVAPVSEGVHRVVIFNPGSNPNQVSSLRLTNPGSQDAEVMVTGIDDAGGTPGTAVLVEVPAAESVTLTASDLESGSGVAGMLGDGQGKWRLAVDAGQPIVVMSLLTSPTGHLTNLSTVSRTRTEDGAHVVPLFPSASDPLGRQGFVRVANNSDEPGEVRIKAYDDSDRNYEAVTLSIEGGETVHFNSDDLELGNARKGLTGSTGPGMGDWRLVLISDLDIDVLAYIRTADGFLTSMHDVVPSADGRHWVAILNPGSNQNQESRLRLVNPGDVDAEVTVDGVDDAGDTPGGQFVLTVPAGASRTLTSAQLESGTDGLSGALGDGAGKWRLTVASDHPIVVMSLLSSPTGHLTNLSTAPDRGPH